METDLSNVAQAIAADVQDKLAQLAKKVNEAHSARADLDAGVGHLVFATMVRQAMDNANASQASTEQGGRPFAERSRTS